VLPTTYTTNMKIIITILLCAIPYSSATITSHHIRNALVQATRYLLTIDPQCAEILRLYDVNNQLIRTHHDTHIATSRMMELCFTNGDTSQFSHFHYTSAINNIQTIASDTLKLLQLNRINTTITIQRLRQQYINLQISTPTNILRAILGQMTALVAYSSSTNNFTTALNDLFIDLASVTSLNRQTPSAHMHLLKTPLAPTLNLCTPSISATVLALDCDTIASRQIDHIISYVRSILTQHNYCAHVQYPLLLATNFHTAHLHFVNISKYTHNDGLYGAVSEVLKHCPLTGGRFQVEIIFLNTICN
jgi:hypothetical protein